MTDTDLAPGFMAVHSIHPEALRGLVQAWTVRHPRAPLEDEWVLVQSHGVARARDHGRLAEEHRCIGQRGAH